MNTLNLSVANIRSIEVYTTLTEYKHTLLSVFNFTVYLLNGDVVKFNSLSAGIKLMGMSTLNGKRVAVKEALKAANWYNEFNARISSDDQENTDHMYNCYYYNKDGRLANVQYEDSCELVHTTGSLIRFQEQFYKAIWNYRYDNFNMKSLESFLKAVWGNLKNDLVGEDKETAKSMMVTIKEQSEQFLEDHPQFHGSIKKGVVANFFYGCSTIYTDKYKETSVTKVAMYTFGTFAARLLGYLNFRTKVQYDVDEYRNMIADFVHREAKFIKAEHSELLQESVKLFYKDFMSKVLNSSSVNKQYAINVVNNLLATNCN